MVKCVECSYENMDGLDYCDGCGAKLEPSPPDVVRAASLERDVQAALRANVRQVESGLIISDDNENKGVTPEGSIIAKDKSGATVVVGLIAGTADFDAVVQVLSSIADLNGKNGSVRGILVASGFSPRALAAARAVANIKLEKYHFTFSFEQVSLGSL
jgi:RecB family endonuclease NucS